MRRVLLLSVIIGLALSQRAEANMFMLDKLNDLVKGLQLSLPMGERHDLKHMAMNRTDSDEDLFDLDAQEIIELAGFKSTTHRVVASDGYITELINVINPRADRRSLKQPPVVLFHGALLDPSSWISGSIRSHHPERYPRNHHADGPVTSSNRSLAFVLANNGYDVWLAGTRGCNKHNIRHTQYETALLDDMMLELDVQPTRLKVSQFLDTLKYMDFSQDQLVEIEYPQQIDEVLRLTGSAQVSLITYSKATQITFKILARDADTSAKIYSHVAIAPILNNVGTSSFWQIVAKLSVNLPNSAGNLIFSQLMASAWTRRLMASMDAHSWFHMATTFVFGDSPKYQTSTELSMIGHFLTSESFTEAKHYCQQILAGKLQKFDHGPIMNRYLYEGSATPPEYDIAQIKSERWMIVSGDHDTLGTPDSAQRYFDSPATKPDKWIRLPHANHMDLVFALDNDVTVNLPVLEFMDKFKVVRLPWKDVNDDDNSEVNIGNNV